MWKNIMMPFKVYSNYQQKYKTLEELDKNFKFSYILDEFSNILSTILFQATFQARYLPVKTYSESFADQEGSLIKQDQNLLQQNYQKLVFLLEIRLQKLVFLHIPNVYFLLILYLPQTKNLFVSIYSCYIFFTNLLNLFTKRKPIENNHRKFYIQASDQKYAIKIFYYIESMGNCSDLGEISQSPVLGRLGPVSDLRIINTIWLKDYQGLFDYQSKEIRQELLKINNNCFLIQKENHKIYQEYNRSNMSEELLKKCHFEIIKRPNFYKIMPIYIENQQYTLQKLLWLVVKSVPNHKYPLKQKDILKFGKQKIKIRQIVLPDLHHPAELQTSHIIKTNKKIYDDIGFHQNAESRLRINGKQDIVNEVVSIATQNEQTCRICLQPGQVNNPLICPCKCTGSVRYIHLQCLRTWLGKQLNFSKTKYCITIKWTPLHCQMCKTHYKYRIYLDNKKYYTVQIPKPAKPYIVMEIIKKSAQYSKIFHFVSLSQNSKLSIGRKKDIDIKLSQDISISRHHANLIYDFENRQFFIEDNKSKFGTLVLVKRNLVITPRTRGISFQIGGEVFTFETHRLEGSIPDYYDQQGYLNVIEKGSGERVEEQQSDQNNEQEDNFDEQLDENINVSQNPTQAMVQSHHRVSQNHSGEINIPNQTHQSVQITQVNNQVPNRQGHNQPQNRLPQPQVQNLDV